MKKKLVVYGTGLVAEVAAFYFRHDTDYEVVAYSNAAEFLTEETKDGLPVVAFEEVENRYPPDQHDIFIAVGYNKTNQVRQARFGEAKAKGYRGATYISPRATYYGTPVGENCMIMENNVIQPFVTIEDDVFLWSGNHIGHHSTVRAHAFISSHVVVSGNCVVGENCFLGVNSTLRDNITLGRFVVVAAGALVMKDCPERTLVKAARSTSAVVEQDLI